MIAVLDHGEVELLDVMGDDHSPARAARISYGRHNEREWSLDAKLTRYLKENRHDSPFEMIELLWRVKLPIFVARQWMRHRTFSYNEFSMRYADPANLADGEQIHYYTPTEFRAPHTANKQSSDGVVLTERDLLQEYVWRNNKAIETYRLLVDQGVAKEMARCVLPVACYTEFVVKGNLRNWLHFFELRADSHAQYEIQVYAFAMIELLSERMPLLCGLLDLPVKQFEV